jgi:hypothetical protein
MGVVVLSLCAVALGTGHTARADAAQPPVGLGTAASFAVLAGSTVTNTGPSVINGDLGVSPGTAISGFPPGTVNGTTHSADAVANQAQSDLTAAYDDAAGRTPAASVPGDIGGLTLTPGVYKSGSSVLVTGDVTLDAQGDPNAVFIFQIGSTLTTASGSRVRLINGASPCNVYWQVGSSATIGTTTTFKGNVLALTSITANTGATFEGRLLARNGAVTLHTNNVTVGACSSTSGDGTGGGGGTPGSGTGRGTGGGGAAIFTTIPTSVAKTVARFGLGRCVSGRFKAVVSGALIRRVVFSLGGRTIATRSHSPFAVSIDGRSGIHTLRAHITFTDGTRPADLKLVFRTCASLRRHVRPQPVQPPRFTG